MLRSAPRRLPLRSLIRTSRVSALHKPGLPICRRYADRKSPPDNGITPPPVSDYIASQTSPSNPETPPDRMPHQTEEDIAIEKIFGEEPTTSVQDGLPPEGVPVEDVFKDNPDLMEYAPKEIKNGSTSSTIEGTENVERNDQLKGYNEPAHVTEESTAYERIISRKDASGAAESSPGEETPASRVPIEEVIGGGEKPTIMDESFKDDHDKPPRGQALRTHDQSTSKATTGAKEMTYANEPTQTTRKSILDLFGPEKTKGRKPQTYKPVRESKVNPLSPHQLNGSNTDLSDWETARGLEQSSNQDINADEWAGSQRGSWESEEPVPPDPAIPAVVESELSKDIRQNYIHIQKPKTRGKRNVSLDKDYSISESIPPSSWDYFYPPQPPPKPLSSSVQTEADGRKVKAKPDVYDPFAGKTKQIRWPFMYNRDKLIELCTNHLMRDGKKATAEKILQQMFLRILEHYPRRHPVTLLAEALDRNAPILKNINKRDSGLKVTITPTPLFEKQRIRIGWMSLINAAGKSREHGTAFPDRLAREVIKVMEGRGAGLPFRIAEHKKAMANKLNVQLPRRTRG